MNEALRKIGEWKPRPKKDRHRGVSAMMMKPIEPDLSSYWARHTWGTYATEIDIPYDTISEALGHDLSTGTYTVFGEQPHSPTPTVSATTANKNQKNLLAISIRIS